MLFYGKYSGVQFAEILLITVRKNIILLEWKPAKNKTLKVYVWFWSGILIWKRWVRDSSISIFFIRISQFLDRFDYFVSMYHYVLGLCMCFVSWSCSEYTNSNM